MANELTKSEAEKVDAYGLMMLKNGVKCGAKTDRKKAKEAIMWVCEGFTDNAGKYHPPIPIKEVVFVASPQAACEAAAKRCKKTPKDLAALIVFHNLWTGWVAYYHAGIYILGEKSGDEALDKDTDTYEGITRTIHAALYLDDIAYVIEYPKTVAIKDNDLDAFKIHRDGGLAVEYSDGTGFAWLNDVGVPDWVACTPPEKLSVTKLMAETNVDVRREGLARLTWDRIIKGLKAKVLDKEAKPKIGKHHDYTLYSVDLGDGKKRTALKMYDVASRKYCFEGVDAECKTVADALAWRDDEAAHRTPEAVT